MRRRFEVRDGVLVDRDGHVLGKLLSITLDVDPALIAEEEGGTTGGEEVPSQLQSAVPSEQQKTLDVGGGEPERGRTDLEIVWATYVAVMEPRKKELDPGGRKTIREALKVATAVECCDAIRGCKASAFHMGSNDRNRKYNALSQILKGKRGGRTTREQIDFFLDHAAKSGVRGSVVSASPAKVSQAKREVLARWEFPADELVVRRGDEAARWLRAQGFGIEYGDDGRPRFRPPVI